MNVLRVGDVLKYRYRSSDLIVMVTEIVGFYECDTEFHAVTLAGANPGHIWRTMGVYDSNGVQLWFFLS